MGWDGIPPLLERLVMSNISCTMILGMFCNDTEWKSESSATNKLTKLRAHLKRKNAFIADAISFLVSVLCWDASTKRFLFTSRKLQLPFALCHCSSLALIADNFHRWKRSSESPFVWFPAEHCLFVGFELQTISFLSFHYLVYMKCAGECGARVKNNCRGGVTSVGLGLDIV